MTMTTMYEIREQMKELYSRYDIYIMTLLKFVLGLFCFFMINGKIGYMEKLDNFAVPVLLSLLCSFLPVNCMVMFAALLILAHLFALSLEVAAVAGAIFLVLLLLYFVIAPQHGYLLILTPLLFSLKLPYAVPLIMGLTGTPIVMVPVSCGVGVYYILHFAAVNASAFGASESESMGDRVKFMIEYMAGNKEMMLTVFAFAAVLCIVYILRRMSMDYAWQIAIGAGALTNVLIFLIGDFALNISGSILGLLLGTVCSVAAAFVVQFFVFSVDYTGTRKIQFEDDEYYYYVKAVPKITISAEDKQVKEIHSRTRGKAKNPSRTRKGSSAGRPSRPHPENRKEARTH